MGYRYDQRKRPQGPQNAAPERTAAPGPDLSALMTGAIRPTAAQKGRSIDLDGAIKAKMEHAFGDLSAVKLYESQAVGQAGAEAIAQGNEIAFAPGMTDFSTRSGQERLGHELSHVMSQRGGQVRGRGFLANTALEARADREGAMAAAGEQVYPGPVTHAISDASPSPSVAGPMQARRRPKAVASQIQPSTDLVSPRIPSLNLNGLKKKPRRNLILDDGPINLLDPEPLSEDDEGLSADPAVIEARRKKMEQIDAADAEKNTEDFYRPGMKELGETLTQRYNSQDYYHGFEETLSSAPEKGQYHLNRLTGLVPSRIFSSLATDRGRGFNMSADKIEQMMDDFMAPHKKGMNEEEKKAAAKRYENGIKSFKKVLLGDMKHAEKKYGKMLTQLHPEDVEAQLGSGKFYDRIFRFNQDANQLMASGGKYFDYENNEEDRQFRDLNTYFGAMSASKVLYTTATKKQGIKNAKELDTMFNNSIFPQQIEAGEKMIQGPGMTPDQQKKYLASLKKRAKKDNRLKGRLFGRYKK